MWLLLFADGFYNSSKVAFPLGVRLGVRMSRSTIHKLTALQIKNATKKGNYPDGGNLYLQVAHNGSKSWLLRYRVNSKSREMGLGSLDSLPVKQAREKAAEYRRLLADGVDPIEHRKIERSNSKQEQEKAKTFKECADEYIENKKGGWSNAKHAQQWSNTLRDYAHPLIGKLPIKEVDIEHVKKILTPIWASKNETATRVRGRIECIIDYAMVMDYRPKGLNPAVWRGNLSHIFPAPNTIKKATHYDALPYNMMADFIPLIKNEISLSARALEFTILTAARTNEVIEAKYSEIDFENNIWVIPKERMEKTKREHRVHLTATAMKIIKDLEPYKVSDYIFYGKGKSGFMSNMSMLNLLKRMRLEVIKNYPHFTVHGFRSSFRDWGAETTSFPNEVLEMALSHTIDNQAEAAYRRGDLFDKRKVLMEAWESFCYSNVKEKSNVVNLSVGAK